MYSTYQRIAGVARPRLGCSPEKGLCDDDKATYEFMRRQRRRRRRWSFLEHYNIDL